MIKFAGTKQVGGREIPVIGLGLSRANCERLLKDQPIVVQLDELVPTLEAEIVIFAGETEKAMVDHFKREGLVTGDTKVYGMHPADPHGK